MVEAEEGTEHSSVAKRLKVVRSLLLDERRKVANQVAEAISALCAVMKVL